MGLDKLTFFFLNKYINYMCGGYRPIIPSYVAYVYNYVYITNFIDILNIRRSSKGSFDKSVFKNSASIR